MGKKKKSKDTELVGVVARLLNSTGETEGYCPWCCQMVGNLLPVNDERHANACPVIHARAVLAKHKAEEPK